MTLTPGTDTYASLVEAEAYAASLTVQGDWATATDPAKEGALRQAARWLDTLQWKGIKATSTQALAWPRYDMWDADGYLVSGIPTALKNAQIEFAIRLIGDDRAADAGGLAPDDLKIGSLQITGLRQTIIPGAVLMMLRPFLRASSGMVVGSR